MNGEGHFKKRKQHKDDWLKIKGEKWLAFKDGWKYARERVCGTCFNDAYHGRDIPEPGDEQGGVASIVGALANATICNIVRLHAFPQVYKSWQHSLQLGMNTM